MACNFRYFCERLKGRTQRRLENRAQLPPIPFPGGNFARLQKFHLSISDFSAASEAETRTEICVPFPKSVESKRSSGFESWGVQEKHKLGKPSRNKHRHESATHFSNNATHPKKPSDSPDPTKQLILDFHAKILSMPGGVSAHPAADYGEKFQSELQNQKGSSNKQGVKASQASCA